MKEINIIKEIDKLMICDDPEYCDDGPFKKNCQLIFLGICFLFPDHDELELDKSKGKYIKSKRCKEIYKISKEKAALGKKLKGL